METNSQWRFCVNVWAGIVGDQVIGPVVLPDRLDGADYATFLRETLPHLLDDVPLAVRNEMWFMHDGAPPHYSITARECLDEAFPNRWIGRRGVVEWPPRSPDLNPLDFYLWGDLKRLVYAEGEVQSLDLLRTKVIEKGRIINDTISFAALRQNFIRRVELCLEMGGDHFEQFI